MVTQASPKRGDRQEHLIFSEAVVERECVSDPNVCKKQVFMAAVRIYRKLMLSKGSHSKNKTNNLS